MSTETQATAPATVANGGRLILTDMDGDVLDVKGFKDQGENVRVATYPAGLSHETHPVLLEREDVVHLYHALGEWLDRHSPCEPAKPEDPRQTPEDDARDYAWPSFGGTQTILDEAKAAVYGDRQADYGHPREDFTRTAILWTGLLHHLLADGEHITPEDIARCMIAVKLARDVHSPKRDNRVDMAGYALTLDRLGTGQ